MSPNDDATLQSHLRFSKFFVLRYSPDCQVVTFARSLISCNSFGLFDKFALQTAFKAVEIHWRL